MGGAYVPTFAQAEYVVQEREIAAMREADDETWRNRFQPLAERGQLRTIDGETQISEILTCWPTPGHSIGHQSVMIRSEGQHALALGDLGIVSWRTGDERMTETYCRRSNEIARTRDYLTLVFRNCYYLWKVALNKGNDGAARINLRTLKSYSGRIDPSLPELNEFNACLAGGESC